MARLECRGGGGGGVDDSQANSTKVHLPKFWCKPFSYSRLKKPFIEFTMYTVEQSNPMIYFSSVNCSVCPQRLSSDYTPDIGAMLALSTMMEVSGSYRIDSLWCMYFQCLLLALCRFTQACITNCWLHVFCILSFSNVAKCKCVFLIWFWFCYLASVWELSFCKYIKSSRLFRLMFSWI